MKHILLIDDDQFMRDLVATKLSTINFSVSVAATAEAGFAEVESRTPDVVLLDLELPDTHGLEVLRELKQSDKTKNIPVIIFSNNDSSEVQDKAKELGADDFFVKIAVDPDVLMSKINAVLS